MRQLSYLKTVTNDIKIATDPNHYGSVPKTLTVLPL